MKKRGQSSVELLVITAIALVVLLGILVYNQDVYFKVSGEFQGTKARDTVDKLADAAQLVYQQGLGSRTKVYLSMPADIDNINISGNIISMTFKGGGTTNAVYRSFPFTVQGSLPTDIGNYAIFLEAKDGYVDISQNASQVVLAVCGDNTKEGSESCDGSDLGGSSCLAQNYGGGNLACFGNCSYDYTPCTPLWVTLFLDDFNRIDNAAMGPNWTETGGQWEILSNRGSANSCDTPGDQITSFTVDLSLKNEANLSFDWEYQQLDSGECLNVDVNDGSGWVNDVFTACSSGSNQDLSGFENLQLGNNISMTSTVQVRFDCLNNHQNDIVYIDNIKIFAPPNNTVDTTAPVVTLNSPTDNFISTNASNTFNCSATDNIGLSSIVLWGNFTGSWLANEISTVSGTSAESLFNLSLENGTFIWNCNATDSSGNFDIGDSNYTLFVNTTIPPPDTSPPVTITSLSSPSNSSTHIYWTWTNPGDADFDHVELWINGTFEANTSNAFYNKTGLTSSTAYQIGTRTVDTSGNVNTTWVNNTAVTSVAVASWKTYFFDNFNRANNANIGINWTEAGGRWDILSNRGHAENCANRDNITSININLASATSSYLTFDWEYTGLDSGECLRLSLNDGLGWKNGVFSRCSTGNNQNALGSQNISLPANITMTSTVQIRFSCNNNNNNDDVFIDNVNVTALK